MWMLSDINHLLKHHLQNQQSTISPSASILQKGCLNVRVATGSSYIHWTDFSRFSTQIKLFNNGSALLAVRDFHIDCVWFKNHIKFPAWASAFLIWNRGPSYNTRLSLKHLHYVKDQSKISRATTTKECRLCVRNSPNSERGENVLQNDIRGQMKKIQTHQTGEQGFPPWLIQRQSEGQEKQERKEEQINSPMKTDHSLFFCPLYCWAFFFCLGTDGGISLLPGRGPEDGKLWDEARARKTNVSDGSHQM